MVRNPEFGAHKSVDLIEQHSHPNYWFNRASDLRAAAGAVWFSMKVDAEQVRGALGLGIGFSMPVACRPVYHLLCGLALEVLLKGVLAHRGQEPPPKHDLLKLAALALVALDATETELLRYYTSTITWGGRYPLPLNPTEEKLRGYWDNAINVLTEATPFAPGSKLKLSKPSGADAWENFHDLFGRIETLRNEPRVLR
jgi:hypothetical protein